MKKIINILSLFIVTFFIGIININAISIVREEFSGYYYERSDNGNNYNSTVLDFYKVGNNIAFCIEPNTPSGTFKREASWDEINLPDTIKDRILLISYYGYQYQEHQTLEYRLATQALLWETIFGGNMKVTYSTEPNGNGEKLSVENEEKEIENLINHHYDIPSFSDVEITTKVGNNIILEDKNNVLKEYDAYSIEDSNIKIENNILTIVPNKIGNYEIIFRKKQVYDRNYILYYDSNAQNMISGGNIDPVYFSIKLKVYGGKLEINKLDSKNNNNIPQGKALLNNAIYGIYDLNDKLIETLTTDNNGYAISGYLPYLGDYKLKEITPSIGYKLNNEEVNFTITKDNLLIHLDTLEDVIEREFNFIKVFSSNETGMMIPEKNILFGIYDLDNNLIVKKETDNDGKINIRLPYGDYILKQITTTNNYEKINDYYFNVKEEGDVITKVFSNSEITSKLKVIKIDYDTNEIVPLSNIKFKIFDVNNNKYLSQLITYPYLKEIDIFETDNNGIFITPFALKSGKYILEELDQKINKYLWNSNKIEFEIGDNSNIIYDEKLDNILEIKFSNKPVKGKINITKLGEELIINNNQINYEKVLLKDIKIALYASHNIYDSIGNLIYYKDELIGTYITNEKGNISIDNLYLGKYYLKEITMLDNYIINDNKYYFELKYIDQYTDIVNYNITIENYLSKGNLEILKVDLFDNNSLSNVEIGIYDKNDNLICIGITDKEGKIYINNLPFGEYYLQEIKPLDGYLINNNKYYFSINKNEDKVNIIMTNERYNVPNTYLNKNNLEYIKEFILLIFSIGLIKYEYKKDN